MATGDTASGSLPATWPNEGEEGSITFPAQMPKSWRARNGQDPDMKKERDRAPRPGAQEIRPSTALLKSALTWFSNHPEAELANLDEEIAPRTAREQHLPT